MNLIRGSGAIFSITLYILTLFSFEKIFGETPVNLLGWGGPHGPSNLFINSISCGIIVIIIAFIPSLFIKNKIEWLTVNLIGVVVATFLTIIIILIYLRVFWG